MGDDLFVRGETVHHLDQAGPAPADVDFALFDRVLRGDDVDELLLTQGDQ